jgi:hypothetical protein
MLSWVLLLVLEAAREVADDLRRATNTQASSQEERAGWCVLPYYESITQQHQHSDQHSENPAITHAAEVRWDAGRRRVANSAGRWYALPVHCRRSISCR